jgi:L-threonylcarbamoyladenylate synthase
LSATISTDVTTAARYLTKGKLVAIPTETVYGLGANALNETAVAGIFTAKNRPSFDPLIIHQSSAVRVLKYAKFIPDDAQKLADAFWPGPLTLVLPKQEVIPDLVSAGLSTVALRVPDHPVAQAVLELVDFPVAAPSANPFGFVSPTTAQHVADQLGERIDFILDGGPCRVGLESTIVGFPAGITTVFRKGGLPLEAIEECLGHPVAIRTHSSSQPEAPGMLTKHYSPGKEMLIMTKIAAFYPIQPADAVLCFGNWPLADHASAAHVFNLSKSGDLTEAAANLFSMLRMLGSGDYPRVWVCPLPEEGLGRAINDRLWRAAAG